MRKTILLILLSVLGLSMFAQNAANQNANQGNTTTTNTSDTTATAATTTTADSADMYTLIDFGKVNELGEFDFLQNDSGGRKSVGYQLPTFENLPAQLYSDQDLQAMQINLKLQNWEVKMSNSSQTVYILNNSMARAVNSQSKGTVLGFRTVFPSYKLAGSVLIRPPFNIPTSYGVKSNSANSEPYQKYGYGVLHNVGLIRSISVETYGRRFPYKLAVVLESQLYGEIEYTIGTLDFDGWRTLVWTNPNYIYDARNKTNGTKPVYPFSEPWLRLKGVRIYRDAEQEGGDFVGYLSKINVVYDKYNVNEQNPDLNDEDFWYLNKKYELIEKYTDLANLAKKRYQDTLSNKGGSQPNYNPTSRSGDNANPDNAPVDSVNNVKQPQ